MIIVVGVTITKTEDSNIFFENIKILKKNKIFSKIIPVINSNKKDIKATINKVGDLVESRKSLSKEMAKHYADAYMLLDADISIKDTNINKAIKYKEKYDVISMYYTGDSPLPLLLTFSSSINDILYGKKELTAVPFNDDELDSSNYLMVGNPGNKNINDILIGKSTRNILPDVNKDNSFDFTSGGASIYFVKKALEKQFVWAKYKGKSIKWYDTYKMMKISHDFKYAKVPIFVKHIRKEKSEVKLSWDEFNRYFLGLEKIYPNNKCFKLKKVLLKSRIEYLLKLMKVRSKKWE